MKKRIVTALLAGVMALSLAACGGSSSDAGQSTSQAQTEESGSGSSQAASGEKRRSMSSPKASSISSGRQWKRERCRQAKT